jgi:PTH1 family peptidyl-tRNA hydrolase
MYLIAGLGNPGREYENTRHNSGFMAVNALAASLQLLELKEKHKLQSFVGEAAYSGHKLILAQPSTFMNLSGVAVAAILQWYKIPIDHLIVIYDDVDLELGRLRLRPGGASGGHHGIESIIAHVHSSDFIRLRIGIGQEGLSGDVSKYVLENFSPEERPKLDEAVQKAAEAALLIVKDGLDPAMNLFNA